MGYGLIECEGSATRCLAHGVIETPRVDLGARLLLIHAGVLELIDQYSPQAMATERQHFAVNKTTALDVAKALGVALLAGEQRGLQVAEYTPASIKLAVVGNGAADKRQVQFMVARLLGLGKAPKPDDAADALAIAICHSRRAAVARLLERTC